MLSKKNRFHGHRSVARVRGGRLQLKGFKVFYSKTKRTDFRMAVVISKKTAKSAVVRNRIRRRFYEAVRKQGILKNQPFDTVFVVQTEAFAEMPAGELENLIEKAAKSIVK